jgi:hypothetical protein
MSNDTTPAQQPPWGGPPTPKRKWSRGRKILFMAIGAVAALIAIGVANGGKSPVTASADSTPSAAAPTAASIIVSAAPSTEAAPSTPAAPQKVTFTVTGSAPGGLDITWGTDSSNHSATTLPFTKTIPIDNTGGVLYYALNAQLSGGGEISCSISVDGVVLKQGSASGGYNICSSQIGQNPLTGTWEGE